MRKIMKKLTFILIAFSLMQFSLKSQTKQDSLLIHETVSDYIEGWYSGDTVRMVKSLHPELAKRGILPSRDGKSTQIAKASYSDMINWTSRNPNLIKENKVLKSDINITIIEIGVNMANAKCVSKQYIDYLHLARINNEWKILNAIWEPNYGSVKKK